MVLLPKSTLVAMRIRYAIWFLSKKFSAKNYLAGNILSISIPPALAIHYLLVTPWEIVTRFIKMNSISNRDNPLRCNIFRKPF